MLCPVHPFPLRGTSPQGETRKWVALDIVSHMTQTANPVTLLASPLGEEVHEVAKGWTVVILIMILDVDVTAKGGTIKLIARRAIPQPSQPRLRQS